METGKGTVRALRLNRPGTTGVTGRDLPAVPQPVPASPMASDRSSPGPSLNVPDTRDELSRALTGLEDFWGASLAHREPCINQGKDCTCGLLGLRRYLGLS
jgi:hypothetical protein